MSQSSPSDDAPNEPSIVVDPGHTTGSKGSEAHIDTRQSKDSDSRQHPRSPNLDHNTEDHHEDEVDGLSRLLAGLGAEECYEILEVSANGVRQLDSLPEKSTRSGYKRSFILRRKTTEQKAREAAVFTNAGPSGDRYDYGKKYPPDEEGKGMDPDARVWRVYLDEAGQFDLDMVEGIKDTVDIMLVSAGLFSAIISTLVGQAYLALQQDFTKVTVAVLLELVEVQRAIATQAPVADIPRSSLNLDSPIDASSTDRWVNGMWFTSLAISVSTALISTLVRQWIQAFVAPTFGTPRDQSRVRQFRYMGIQAWHVPLIVGLLPTLLHLSLFLFLVGLIILLFSLDNAIAIVVLVITVLAYAAYFVTNLLPVWKPQSPYKTPLSSAFFVLMRTCTLFLPRWKRAAQLLVWSRFTSQKLDGGADDNEHDRRNHCQTLQEKEASAVRDHDHALEAHAFNWLCKMSANPSVSEVVTHAISDLPISYSSRGILRSGATMDHICEEVYRFQDWNHLPDLGSLSQDEVTRCYTYFHAHLQLTTNLTRRQGNHIERDSDHSWCSKLLQAVTALAHEHTNFPHHARFSYLQHASLDPLHLWSGDFLTVQAEQLASLTPPRTSWRVWTSLLRGAVIAGSRQRTACSITGNLPSLMSLLRFCEHSRDSPLLANFLLMAYLCHATRVEGLPVGDNQALWAALYYEESFHRDFDSYRALLQYKTLIYSHLLISIAHNTPEQETPLSHVVQTLLPFVDITDYWTPSLPINEGHPLLGVLPILLPTPTTIQDITSSFDQDTLPTSRLQGLLQGVRQVASMLHLLVDHPHKWDVFFSNDCLRAFALLFKHLSFYSNEEPSQKREHIHYVLTNLESLWVCNILSWNVWDDYRLTAKDILQETIAWNPMDQVWDSLPSQLSESLLLPPHCKHHVPELLEMLEPILTEARNKYQLSSTSGPEPEPGTHGHIEVDIPEAQAPPSQGRHIWHRLRTQTRGLLYAGGQPRRLNVEVDETNEKREVDPV